MSDDEARHCWKRLNWWAQLDAMAEPERAEFLAGFGVDWAPPQRPTNDDVEALRAWIRARVRRSVERREWALGAFALYIEVHLGASLCSDGRDRVVGRAALLLAGLEMQSLLPTSDAKREEAAREAKHEQLLRDVEWRKHELQQAHTKLAEAERRVAMFEGDS
jgi:hypothetical protein